MARKTKAQREEDARKSKRSEAGKRGAMTRRQKALADEVVADEVAAAKKSRPAKVLVPKRERVDGDGKVRAGSRQVRVKTDENGDIIPGSAETVHEEELVDPVYTLSEQELATYRMTVANAAEAARITAIASIASNGFWAALRAKHDLPESMSFYADTGEVYPASPSGDGVE